MVDFWNSRYKQNDFVYGKKPNLFFKSSIDELNFSGEILLPAEGEGRNAIYAAKKGWNVIAFDISKEGKKKARQLARLENVQIEYIVGELDNLNLKKGSFDVVALIYAHFPANQKNQIHKKLAGLVKRDGYLILEGFSKNNLSYRERNPKVGGPENVEMLFSKQEIKDYYKGFEIIKLQEKEIELKEGSYHNGLASVIRFIGRKTT